MKDSHGKADAHRKWEQQSNTKGAKSLEEKTKRKTWEEIEKRTETEGSTRRSWELLTQVVK